MSRSFTAIENDWYLPRRDTRCLAERMEGCLPRDRGDACYRLDDYYQRIGAGCGGVEGRISCKKVPFFADPRGTPLQAGLVEAK